MTKLTAKRELEKSIPETFYPMNSALTVAVEEINKSDNLEKILAYLLTQKSNDTSWNEGVMFAVNTIQSNLKECTL